VFSSIVHAIIVVSKPKQHPFNGNLPFLRAERKGLAKIADYLHVSICAVPALKTK